MALNTIFGCNTKNQFSCLIKCRCERSKNHFNPLAELERTAHPHHTYAKQNIHRMRLVKANTSTRKGKEKKTIRVKAHR